MRQCSRNLPLRTIKACVANGEFPHDDNEQQRLA